jgi:hypothetical protein
VYTLPEDVTTAENDPPHATWRGSSSSGNVILTLVLMVFFEASPLSPFSLTPSCPW